MNILRHEQNEHIIAYHCEQANRFCQLADAAFEADDFDLEDYYDDKAEFHRARYDLLVELQAEIDKAIFLDTLSR